MNQALFSTPVSLRSIRVADDFWKKEMELVRTEVIPYQWEALNDRVEGAAPSYCMRNFKIAGKMNRQKQREGSSYVAPTYTFRGFEALPEDPAHLEDKFYGFVFQDSDFSKWIEAVGYSLTQHPDPALEEIADGAIDIVCAAQQEDGYLDTYYIINGKDQIFSNLRDHHELYCFGHLVEGAVAYYQATGKDKLLQAAERFADYVDRCFGPEEDKCKGYPGHEIAEMALVRLYEATGNDRYLELSRFFVEERGKKPYYFDREDHPDIRDKNPDTLRYFYNQAHLPVRQQDEATGHAVRAVYLYSGMADIARLKNDDTMFDACARLWNDIVEKKMYITGGIGSTHLGEAFTFGYDLPNDTAYAETCASIGLVFFARRMLEMKPDSKYANVMERALYNGILSGMALDGRSFFYVNPLEVNPLACHRDERKFHVKPVRQKWFGCACCPPNIARLVSSIGSYAFSENEDTLFVHLYMGSTVEKYIGETCARVEVDSKLPWDGSVTIRVCAEGTPLTLALRIPDWTSGFDFTQPEGFLVREENGYLYLTGDWSDSDTIGLTFGMKPQFVVSADAVREDAGKTALVRGPVVYCLEEQDNGADLHLLSVDACAPVTEKRMNIAGTNVIALEVPGYRKKAYEEPAAAAAAGSTIGQADTNSRRIPAQSPVTHASTGLYRAFTPATYEPVTLTYIPYYTWANRGENEMQVWTKIAGGMTLD